MGNQFRVAEALALMAKRNDVIQDTHGNVSAKDGDVIWIKPSGVPYENIKYDDVCGISLIDGEQVAGTLKPSVDTAHHVSIYKNNPDIGAICHTHSPNVVAHAILGQVVKCLCTEQADYFGGDVPCFAYRDHNSWGSIISLNLLRYTDTRKAVILQCHGGLTFADDPVQAVKLAIQLENVARKNVLAGIHLAGYVPTPFGHSEVEKWHRRYNEVYGQK